MKVDHCVVMEIDRVDKPEQDKLNQINEPILPIVHI